MTTYNVYRDGEKIATGLTEKTYTDIGLTPNTSYEYQVSAENRAGESKLSDPITVKTDYSEVESVTVSPKELTFSTIGNARQLTATVEPSTAKQTVTWESSDTSVATVNEDGRVVARGYGEATITVTSTEKDVKDICVVTVVNETEAESIEVSPKTNNLVIGGTRNLTATVLPETANKEVYWSSSDDSIATVNESSQVTAVGEGTATITVVSVENDQLKDTATVNVTQPEEGD